MSNCGYRHEARKEGDVHLRASWIGTRADIVARFGVILAGAPLWVLGSPCPDFIVGASIGLDVPEKTVEILGDARATHREAMA